MTIRLKAIGGVFAAAAVAAGAPAHALSIQTVAFSFPTTTLATTTHTSPLTQASAVQTFGLPSFDFNQGVLEQVDLSLGATLGIDGSLNAHLFATAGATISASATLSGPNFSASSAPLTATLSCPNLFCSETTGPINAGFGINRTFTDIQSLETYGGTFGQPVVSEQVSVTLTPDHGADLGGCGAFGTNCHFGSETVANTATLSSNPGSSITFGYLLHANPTLMANGHTLTGLPTLDFGTRVQGSGVQSLGAVLFNTGLPGTMTGLDLNSFTRPNNAPVSLTLQSSLTNLPASFGDPFQVLLNTDTVGAFEDTFFLHLSDTNSGVGLQFETLSLTVRGNVIAAPPPPPPVNGVPEPASWALLLTGFAGLGAALRAGRRRLRDA